MADTAFTTQTISVEHVTSHSNKRFEDARAKLEALLPRIDDGIFTLLRYSKGERAARVRRLSAAFHFCTAGPRGSAGDRSASLPSAAIRHRQSVHRV